MGEKKLSIYYDLIAVPLQFSKYQYMRFFFTTILGVKSMHTLIENRAEFCCLHHLTMYLFCAWNNRTVWDAVLDIPKNTTTSKCIFDFYVFFNVLFQKVLSRGHLKRFYGS